MSKREQDNYTQNDNQDKATQVKRDKIRRLNDKFRKSLSGGQILLTPGILGLGNDAAKAILNNICHYNRFDDDIDPYGEHDMGSFSHREKRIFWKIDYYDVLLERGSPDPSDEFLTCRVLTVMLASEY